MISFVFGFGWSFAVVAGFAFHVDRPPNAFFLTRFLGAKTIGVCRVVHVLLLLVHVRLCGERGGISYLLQKVSKHGRSTNGGSSLGHGASVFWRGGFLPCNPSQDLRRRL